MKALLSRLYRAAIPKLLTFLGFGSTLTFMACYAPAPEDYHVHAFPLTLQFDSEAQQKESVSVEANGQWFVSEVSPFINISVTNGYGDAVIYVTINEANESTAMREGIIELKSFEDPSSTAKVHVYQFGKNYYDY